MTSLTCLSTAVECLRANNIFPIANASSYEGSRYPQNALTYDRSNNFCGTYKDNDWWAVDFKVKVAVHSYSIATIDFNGWIYNWDAEISNDFIKWTKVDERRNTYCYTEPMFSTNPVNSAKYFRIIGRGLSAKDDRPNIAFHYIKIFGLILIPSAPLKIVSSKCSRYTLSFLFSVSIFLK